MWRAACLGASWGLSQAGWGCCVLQMFVFSIINGLLLNKKKQETTKGKGTKVTFLKL